MRHRLAHPLPKKPKLPPGYTLRTAKEDDAAGLAGVLSVAFGEPWDDERVRAELLEHLHVPTTYLVDFGAEVVATASYQLQPADFPSSGWLHWVATRPGHTGQGFGTALTIQVLERCAEEGRSDALLTTDDFRLGAVATYLKCGFEPDPWHPSHPDRWKSVLAALADRGSPNARFDATSWVDR